MSVTDAVAGIGGSFYTWLGIRPALDGIPVALTALHQWVLWKAEQKPKGGMNKIPYQPNGRKASSTDSETWSDFGTVWSAYEEDPDAYAGIGFVITDRDHFIGGDLDHCHNAETGELTAQAKRIIDALETYSEVSPSGTGVRFLGHGEQTRSFLGNGIEVYTAGRYLTITGERINGHEEPQQIPPAYLDRLRELATGRKGTGAAPEGKSTDPVVEALKARGLYRRDLQDGRHQVTCPWADQHTGGDKTGTVYMEANFNGHANAGFVCQHAHCGNKRLADLLGFLGVERSTNEAPALDLGELPEGLDFRLLQPRRWVVVDRFLQGYVTISAAPPGCGKTAYEIASAVSVATGISYTGEDCRKRGRAWVYANEEDSVEMLRRLGALCILHRIRPNDLRNDLRLSSGYGHSLVIAKRIESTGDVVPTPVVGELIRAPKDWQCIAFAVDPLISTHRANENSNTDLEAVMQQWRRVAFETNCAIEIPTHIPKSPENSEWHAGNLNAIRGASSIAGAARQVVTLARMSKDTAQSYGIDKKEARDLVRLDRAKGSYSPPAEEATWLQMRSVCLENNPEFPDWVGAFQPYPHQLKRVEGVRDAGKDERLSSLRVGIKLLDVKPGKRVPLSAVIDELAGQTRLSYRSARGVCRSCCCSWWWSFP
jgi:hypothetical protein